MNKQDVSNLLQFIRESEQGVYSNKNDEFLFNTLDDAKDILESLFENIDLYYQIDELIRDDIIDNELLRDVLWKAEDCDNDLNLKKIVGVYELEEEEKVIELYGRMKHFKHFSKLLDSLTYGVDDFSILYNYKDLIIAFVRNAKVNDTISDWLIETENERLRCLDYEELAEKVIEKLGKE